MTHTPGKWYVTGSESGGAMIVSNDVIIARWPIAGPSNNVANARLIAAAPELKNLLFHALHYIETPGDFTETERLELCQDIDDLIAKAEGRA